MTQIGSLNDIAIGKAGMNTANDLLQMITGRGLHPGVGDQDPDGTEVGTKADHAGGEEMHLRADLVPAEKEKGKETRL